MIENAFAKQIQVILFLAVTSLIIVSYAYKKGFFRIGNIRPPLSITFWNVFSVFAIYIGCMLVAASLIAKLLKHSLNLDTSTLLALTQMTTIGLSFLLLVLYGLNNKLVMQQIWKDRSSQDSWVKDLGMGVITWCVAFPIVATLGELFDWLIYGVLKFQQHDQLAIRYLKNSFNSPLSLSLALFTIIVSAPFIEEFLFRGCLQNWLKRHLGFKAAILVTSFFFACFHFSVSQGAGNISLFLSLLIFACFLGFLYEKQRSLFASIGLHMTFNLISAFRLIFGPDI